MASGVMRFGHSVWEDGEKHSTYTEIVTDNERNHEKDNEKQYEAVRAGFPLWP